MQYRHAVGRWIQLAVWASAGGLLWWLTEHRRPSVAVVMALGVPAGYRLLRFVLARMAHGAFARGDARRARRLYRVSRWLAPGRRLRRALGVSEAGCDLVGGRYAEALARLESMDGHTLGPVARATWLNNLAYARARSGIDPRQALADIDEAMRLCPDLVGFHHTRGVALLALGRTDEAIDELDRVHALTEGEPEPELEAERCFDLATAWQQKNEPGYAGDYLQRAIARAPTSRWANLSRQALPGNGADNR